MFVIIYLVTLISYKLQILHGYFQMIIMNDIMLEIQAVNCRFLLRFLVNNRFF